MNQRPISVDSTGEKCGIFVVRRHDNAVALKTAEVLGQSERHARPTARIRGVSDCVLFQFRNECNARILNTPDFFGIFRRIWHQRGLGIDLPSIFAIRRSSRTQMRQASSIFHSAKEKSRSIREQCGARIEDAVDGVRPILACKDGVGWMAQQERLVTSTRCGQKCSLGALHDGISNCSGSCSECISRSAIKNDSVDSAP